MTEGGADRTRQEEARDNRENMAKIARVARRAGRTHVDQSANFLEDYHQVMDEITIVGRNQETIRGLRAVVNAQAGLTENALVYTNRVLQGAGKGPGDFVRALHTLFSRNKGARGGNLDPDEFSWDKLCRNVYDAGLFAPVHVSEHLLGPLDISAREKKARPAAEKAARPPPDVVGEEINPDAVTGDVHESDKQETDLIMQSMHDVLQERQGAGLTTRYLDLVMNRRSFAQFVENVFALSFLIKDTIVGVRPSEDGWLVELVERAARRREKEGAAEARQLCLSYNMGDWEELARHCREELMPHRDAPGDGGGAGPSRPPAKRRRGAGGDRGDGE